MAKQTRQPKRLGRGLDALIGSLGQDAEQADLQAPAATAGSATAAAPPESPPSQAVAHQVPLAKIQPNPYQPRKRLDDKSLDQLAESIRTSGIIQPVIVRPSGSGYQLVAGQRRIEAARRAGLEAVPVVVRDADDEQMLEIALIENIHREDLNSIDRARAYREYCDTFSLTADQLAQRLGEDRTTVTNYMRLLDLPESVRELVVQGSLSMGHARALLGVEDAVRAGELAQRVVDEGLSVRQVEKIVADQRSGGNGQASSGDATPTEPTQKKPNVADLEQRLGSALSTKVAIREGKRKGRGRISIEFYSLDDFDRIFEHICGRSDF